MISNKAKSLSSAGHINQSFKAGTEGQQRFYDSCRALNKEIKKTSKSDDIVNHTDFVVDGQTFDVKGLKKTQKEGKILLEIKNVQGKMGWCNHELKPEWIAFDFGAFFLHVKNADLFNLAKEKCDLRDTVYRVNECLYKGYRRKGRKDLMSMVTLQDVLNGCEYWFLPYAKYQLPLEEV